MKKQKEAVETMNSAERIMNLHEELFQCSERMLQKAKKRQWSDLIEEECRFVDYFDQISRAGSVSELSQEQSVQQRMLLKKIRTRSDKTREILVSRSEELERLAASDSGHDSQSGKGQKISTDKSGVSVYLN